MGTLIRMMAAASVSLASSAAAEPLIFDNGRIFISARVEGVPTEALLDSAAEASLLDTQFAREAKLPTGVRQEIRGSGGATMAHIVEGVTIKVLGVELHPEAVVVMDLGELSKRLIKRPTHVIIGRELFDSARLQINLAGRSIHAVASTGTPPGKRLPLTAHAGVEAVQVFVGKHQAQAEFDLGNGSDVLISRSFANKLGLRPIGKKAGGGIGGEVTRDLVEIPCLVVADRTFLAVRAAIDDQPNANDLNIGTSILSHFLITTDFKQRAVWLSPLARKR